MLQGVAGTTQTEASSAGQQLKKMLVVGGGSLYAVQPLKQLGKLALMRYNHTVWN